MTPTGLLSRLLQEERDCTTDFELLSAFLSKHPDVDYEDVTQQLGCLGDGTLLDLHLAFIAWYFQDLGGMFRVTRNPAFETPWMVSTSATTSGRYTPRKTTWSGRPTAKSGH